LTRTFDARRQPGLAIFTLEKDGSLVPYCTLPAGGDCGYAEAIEYGPGMLVSYYSSHEADPPQSANVYLALVPLKK
jgi:hypothetical protein